MKNFVVNSFNEILLTLLEFVPLHLQRRSLSRPPTPAGMSARQRNPFHLSKASILVVAQMTKYTTKQLKKNPSVRYKQIQTKTTTWPAFTSRDTDENIISYCLDPASLSSTLERVFMEAPHLIAPEAWEGRNLGSVAGGKQEVNTALHGKKKTIQEAVFVLSFYVLFTEGWR